METMGFRRQKSTLFFNFPMSRASLTVGQIKLAGSHGNPVASPFLDGAVVRMETGETFVDFDAFDVARGVLDLSASPADRVVASGLVFVAE